MPSRAWLSATSMRCVASCSFVIHFPVIIDLKRSLGVRSPVTDLSLAVSVLSESDCWLLAYMGRFSASAVQFRQTEVALVRQVQPFGLRQP